LISAKNENMVAAHNYKENIKKLNYEQIKEIKSKVEKDYLLV